MSVGFRFGPTWSTHWFQIDIDIPAECDPNQNLVLRFDAECEALLWSLNEQPLQGYSIFFSLSNLKLVLRL